MKIKDQSPLLWLSLAASVVAMPAASANAQTATKPAPAAATPAKAAENTPAANRAQAYFHAAMASMYEEQAVSTSRPEYVQHAIEEYKAAMNADPGSPQLSDGLADLYFRTGRVSEAESTARGLLKTNPDDVDAHKLLGRIYLRQLGEQQNSVSSSSPTGNTLDQAIAEYEKIIALQPKSGRPHGAGPALHGEASVSQGGRAVQNCEGH